MVSANEGPCAQCIVSVQHDDEVKDGKRTIEQLVSEITGRLENDGVLAEPQSTITHIKSTVVGYHCASCGTKWEIHNSEGLGPTVHWHPLFP